MGFAGTDAVWGPIEEFTGLHDRNGREIYEGDFLQRRWFAMPGFPNPELEGKVVETAAIEWDDEELFFRFGTGNIGVYNAYGCMRNFEVIGNIHDNPELMEVE